MYIPTSAAALPVALASLGPDSTVAFMVKPLTQADHTALGFELFRHNIAPISQETFRATMIDEIYNIFPEAEADPKADLLDEFWQATDIYNAAVEEWQMQEDQRLLDQHAGAPIRPMMPRPVHTLGIRHRSRGEMLARDILELSQRMRNLVVEMQTYDIRSREGLARLLIESWSGTKTPFSKVDGIVPAFVWQQLKEELGRVAIEELKTAINSLGVLKETEKGNSDSPLDIASDQTGSPAPSGASEASDGISTASNTGPVLSDESAPTTEPSYRSTSTSLGAIAREDPSLTAGV